MADLVPVKFIIGGYLTQFVVEKVFQNGRFERFDVKLALADTWHAETSMIFSFIDARGIKIGNGGEVHLGEQLFLAISSISHWCWEDLRFQVNDIEECMQLSLFCCAYEEGDDLFLPGAAPNQGKAQ